MLAVAAVPHSIHSLRNWLQMTLFGQDDKIESSSSSSEAIWIVIGAEILSNFCCRLGFSPGNFLNVDVGPSAKLLEKLGLKLKQKIGQQYFSPGRSRITWLEGDNVCIYRIGTALRASKPMIPLDNLPRSGVRAPCATCTNHYPQTRRLGHINYLVIYYFQFDISETVAMFGRVEHVANATMD